MKCPECGALITDYIQREVPLVGVGTDSEKIPQCECGWRAK